MNRAFLEEIGGVKTARREAVSLLLAKALLKGNAPSSVDSKQLLKLAKKNKVLLRSADLFGSGESSTCSGRVLRFKSKRQRQHDSDAVLIRNSLGPG